MTEVEDKQKKISELYKTKSIILQYLSDLSNPDYYFVIGRGYKNVFTSHVSSFNNLEDGFLNKIKKMTIEQYNRTLEDVEKELNELLKCN